MSAAGGLQALAPLIGVWNTTIEIIADDGERTTHHATDTYRWALGKAFVLHDVSGTMAGRKVRTLEIIGEGKGGKFACRSYDSSGAVDDFTARMKGARWTIKGKHLKFAGAFSADGETLSGEWKQRRKGEWRAWLAVTLVKKARGRRKAA